MFGVGGEVVLDVRLRWCWLHKGRAERRLDVAFPLVICARASECTIDPRASYAFTHSV